MSTNHPDQKKKKTRGRPEEVDPRLTYSLTRLLAEEYGVTSWDLALVGDGSGVGWDMAMGWAGVLHDRCQHRRCWLYGADSSGTITHAELECYLKLLRWYRCGPGKRRVKERLTTVPDGRLLVHVISDSDLIVNQGNRRAPRQSNGELWAGLDFIEALGYEIHWHWLRRATTALNVLVDYLAGKSREAVAALAKVQLPEGVLPYDLNKTETAETGEPSDIPSGLPQ